MERLINHNPKDIDMEQSFRRAEKLIDRIIPWLVIILLFVIIAEFAWGEALEHYEHYIEIFDLFVVMVFAADLVFKYMENERFTSFLKKCWLDILAIFPFSLIFRAVSWFAGTMHIAQTISEGQRILHETIEIEKEGAMIAEELAKSGRMERIAKARWLPRYLRIFQRIPRLVKIVPHRKRKRELAAAVKQEDKRQERASDSHEPVTRRGARAKARAKLK